MFRTLRYPKFRLMDYFIIILLGHVKRRPCKKQFNTSYKGPFIMPRILNVFCRAFYTQYITTMAHFVVLFSIDVQWRDLFLALFFLEQFPSQGFFFPNLMFTILFNMWMLGSNKCTFNCKWNSKMMIVKMVLFAFLLIK